VPPTNHIYFNKQRHISLTLYLSHTLSLSLSLSLSPFPSLKRFYSDPYIHE
jgi:hypothetical protein